MAMSKVLQLEGERRLAETPVLSFMTLLSMPRARLLELGETLNRLPQPCRRFLAGVRQVQERAKKAADLMVSQLRERHQGQWKDGRAEAAIQMLAEIVYGTWVESLLLLWRTKFSDPVAKYLR